VNPYLPYHRPLHGIEYFIKKRRPLLGNRKTNSDATMEYVTFLVMNEVPLRKSSVQRVSSPKFTVDRRTRDRSWQTVATGGGVEAVA
jgi:hypothetical protein